MNKTTKTMKAILAVNIYRLLSGIDMKRLSGRAKVGLTRVLLALLPTAKEFETAEQEAVRKLTEGRETEQELLRKSSRGEELTAEEKERAEAFGKELSDGMTAALEDVREKDVTVELTPLDDDTLGEVYEAIGSVTAGDLLTLQPILGA